LEKAADLAELALSGGAAQATAFAWADAARAFEGAILLVNATSLGMRGAPPLEIPSLEGLAPAAAVYDLVYAPRRTALLEAAATLGLKTIEGLDMLIGQARPSFRAFFSASPPESVDARALLAGAKPENTPLPWPTSSER
jgi:shikimate dehydrogenase